MKMNRKWAMPNKNTFDVLPIGKMVKQYLLQSQISIDPFARNKEWATYTNDLNPNTTAQYHLDVLEFLQLILEKGIQPDLVLFDPPYSPNQIKVCYEGFGKKMNQKEAQRTGWKQERNLINDLLAPNGYVLSFGWNSIGMGKKRGYVIEEILLVCHGGSGHNDTICMAEKRK